jgi:superfamily II DNA/RNA helicase
MTEAFAKLGLNEKLLRAIKDAGFSAPSEIQEKAIPLVIAGKDVLGGSATGSGKTLAFGAGILQNTEKGMGIQALILTPTRELADQISGVLKKFSRYCDISITEIYGGVSIEPQIGRLRRAEIVVGTPGRVLDHIERGTINLSHVKTLVLDEADRMLDMGFINDVEDIIKVCKNRTQTLLFSATLSADIEHIAKRHMKNPTNIEVYSYVDSSKLKQIWYDAPNNVKFSLLVHLLRQEKGGLVMVFCNTRANVDFVTKNLKNNGLHALAVHGGLSQNKRSSTMDFFNSQEVSILVCTDVAARGLDIKGVSHVYNFDIPKTSEEYVHRIGRTARAGKEGIAISIVTQRDYDNFRRVMEDPELKLEQVEVPEVEQVRVHFESRGEGRFDRGRGGFRGGGRDYGRSRGRGYGRPGNYSRR